MGWVVQSQRELQVSDSYIDGMPNDEYHKPENGLGSTGVKNFIEDPASVIWSIEAEQDQEKLKALDFGTDFHLYFLEPDEFKKTRKVLPEFNRRTNQGKQDEKELIEQWKKDGIVSVKHEDMIKLDAMRESALAHPTISAIMKLKGVSERSYFWTDPKTGVKCKCRPDRLVLDINDGNRPAFMKKDFSDCQTLVMDVKSIGQFDKMQNQIENLKYFVQDAFYTKGIEQVTNTKVCFVFAFVSTTMSLGRYPVQVVALSDTAKFDGKNAVNDALRDYAAMSNVEDQSVWQTVVTMDRPMWATQEEEIF